MSDIIQIQNVIKSFKSVQAVKGVSLQIGEGEFVGLLGPNGAGKTTLVEMIEGLQKPDSGEIIVAGQNWEKGSEEIHKVLGLSLQETRFIDELKVMETIALFASFHQVGKERQEEVLHITDLEAKRNARTSQLSGGQRQRLSLALAILHKPKILLLDEPTTGLDPAARRELWNILRNLQQKERTSMILTTHYMEEAEFLCDRIIIMNEGKFIAEGKVAELLSRHTDGEIIEFTVKEKIQSSFFEKEFSEAKWKLAEDELEGRLTVRNLSIDLPRFVRLIEGQGNIFVKLECRKATLEDVFLTLTGRRLHD